MKKHKTKSKHFIVSLIQDDLIHSKLVYALCDLGLQAEIYMVDISDKVVSLMGFTDKEQNEFVFEYYRDLLKRGKYIDITENNAGIHQLARDIYHELCLQKPLR